MLFTTSYGHESLVVRFTFLQGHMVEEICGSAKGTSLVFVGFYLFRKRENHTVNEEEKGQETTGKANAVVLCQWYGETYAPGEP